MLLALDATFVVAGPGRRARRSPAAEFFHGFLETALAPDELLTEIRVPEDRRRAGSSYQKFNRRAQDWAIVGALAVRATARRRVALVNMGAHAAARARRSRRRSRRGASAADAAAHAAEGTEPPADLNASAEYREHLARVLVRRALRGRRGRLSPCASPRSCSPPGRGARLRRRRPEAARSLLGGRPLVALGARRGRRERAAPGRARRRSRRRRGRGGARRPAVDGRARAATGTTGIAPTALHAALDALEAYAEVDAVCIGLADQPLRRRRGVPAARARRTTTGADLAVATYGGVRGNPVLLGRALWAEALDARRATSAPGR